LVGGPGNFVGTHAFDFATSKFGTPRMPNFGGN
jgi:hypothetical protein